MKTRSFLILLGILWGVEGHPCPSYCTCQIHDSLRQASCVQRGLISLDINIPRTVQWLKLSHNTIQTVEDSHFINLGTTGLVILELNNNAIKFIGDEAFKGLNELEWVDLSHNHLYFIYPDTFLGNMGLKWLSLYDNPLEVIQFGPVIRSQTIQEFHFGRCSQRFIRPDVFSGLPRLITLNLTSNGLSRLKDGIFENNPSLGVVDLTGNPLDCDSSPIIKHLRDISVSVIGVKCVESSAVEILPGVHLSPENSDYKLHPGTHINQDTDPGIDLFPEETDAAQNECPKVEISECPQDQTMNFVYLIVVFITGLTMGAALAITFAVSYIVCSRGKFAPPAYSELQR